MADAWDEFQKAPAGGGWDEFRRVESPSPAPKPKTVGFDGKEMTAGHVAKLAATSPVGLAEVALGLGTNAALYPLALAADAGERLSPWKAGGSEARMPPPGHPRAPDYTEEEWRRQNDLAASRDARARGDREARGVMSLAYAPKTDAGKQLAGEVGALFRGTLGRVGSGAGEVAAYAARQAGAEAPEEQEIRRTAEEATNAVAGAMLPGAIGRTRALLRGGGQTAASTPMTAAAPQGQAATAGAAAQSQVTVVPGKARSLSDRLLRVPEPIPEAQFLRERGVRLTKGQYDPASAYAQVEIASTSKGGVGPLIRKQRQQALEDAMGQAFEVAKPPGVKVELAGDVNTKFASLSKAWDDAYDAVRASGEEIYPAIHDGKGGVALRSTANRPGAFQQIVEDPNAIWDEASRAQARKFLGNQLSRLPDAKGAVGRVPLGDMLTVLKDVRKARRSAIQGEKWDLGDILGRAEDAVEQAIETQASPETAARLRELNAGYRNLKVVEDAVVRTGDAPGGITPFRLSSAVKAMEPSRKRYAAGGGGDMRRLSQSIAKVFDESASPPTGARLLTAAPSWVNDTLVAPTIYIKNSARAGASAPASVRFRQALARRRMAPMATSAAGPVPPLAALLGLPTVDAQGRPIQFPFALPPAAAEDRE